MISHSDHFDHSEVWSKISTFFCSTSWYMPKAAHFSHCGVSSKMCIPLMPWAITNNSDHSSQTPASSAYIACLHATPIETSREKQYVISIWKIVLLKKNTPQTQWFSHLPQLFMTLWHIIYPICGQTHMTFLKFPRCSEPLACSKRWPQLYILVYLEKTHLDVF